MTKTAPQFKYPGTRVAVDGNTAVIMCEREGTDAAGAYPITPSTQMGEYWAEAAAAGHLNISGRPLIFIEPEGEHAAAAVTAGLSMTGLRASNFSSGQGIAYMHESLYAAVGKRLTYVLNIGARAMTKATLNVHAGHDDYHCIDDTGFFQMFAKDGQSAADLNIIAHRIAEMALTPGVIAQDGFLTTHLIESIQIPERELIAEYLGLPSDTIETPTPAQRIIYGDQRRRIPEIWTVDDPVMSGVVQNQDSYMQSVAAQRPYFFDHIPELAARAFNDFAALTGRRYERVMTYRCEDAEYLIFGQGSIISTAEAVADYLRETRGIKIGVVNLLMFRPFPADLISRALKGKKGVAVLERVDQPLAVDLPLMREVRATMSRCLENGRDAKHPAFPELETYTSISDAPALYSGSFGMGSRDLQPEGIIGAIENMLPNGAHQKFFYLSIDFLRDNPVSPKHQIHQENIEDKYPKIRQLAIRGSENPNLMPDSSITVRMHSVGRLGCDHDRQESGDDAVRFARFRHQGQSKIRIGEEGAADDLLPVRGARTDPHQLRVLLRRCGPLARPQCVQSHQRRGRTEGAGRLHHPKRQAVCRGRLEQHSGSLSPHHCRQEDPGLLPGRVPNRSRRSERSRLAAAHARHRLSGCILFRITDRRQSRLVSGTATRGHSQPTEAQVRRQRRPHREREHVGGQTRIRRSQTGALRVDGRGTVEAETERPANPRCRCC